MREEMGGKKGINRRGEPTLRRKHARLEFMASRRDGKFSTAKKLSKNKEAREIHGLPLISSVANLTRYDKKLAKI